VRGFAAKALSANEQALAFKRKIKRARLGLASCRYSLELKASELHRRVFHNWVVASFVQLAEDDLGG
jgi:hypothetical protein